MLRYLSVFPFVLLAAFAPPADAQPAALPANWVALPANAAGVQMWLDMNNVITHSNGHYRLVPYRLRAPNQPDSLAWVEADCGRWGSRFIGRIEWWPSGAPNPIPDGEWLYVERSTPLMSGYLLRAICGG